MTEAFDIFIRVLDHAGCRPKVYGGHRANAMCPAHEDSSPSLSIRSGATGRVLVHCFAGCETQQVLDALGVTWKALFVDDGWQEGGVIAYYKPDPIALGILSDALGTPVEREPIKAPARPARISIPRVGIPRVRA